MILTSFSQEEYEQTIRDESYNEGREQLLQELIKKNLEKGYAPEEIADFLDEDIEEIQRLINQIQSDC